MDTFFLEVHGRSRIKREQILEGARHVFLREGFAAASTDVLAQEAGVSKGTLYAYYPSKERLFVEIIHKQLLENPQVQGLDMIDQCTPHHLAELRLVMLSLAQKVIATLMQPETLALLRIVIADAHRFPQLVETLRSTIPERVAVAVSLLLKRARDNGIALRQGDTTIMTRLFIGPLLSYVVFDGLLHPQNESRSPDGEQIEIIVNLFLDAILEKREAERRCS